MWQLGLVLTYPLSKPDILASQSMINRRRKRQTVCFRPRATEKRPLLNTNYLNYQDWCGAVTMVHHQWKVVDEIRRYQQTHPHV